MLTSKLSLKSDKNSVEIRVRDAALNVVAKGFGKLESDLEPGIYQIEYRAADRIQQELIALRPNETYSKLNLDLPFPSPVPLDGTSTSRETYRHAVEQMSLNPVGDQANSSGLLVFICKMDQGSNVPINPNSAQDWQLLDKNFDLVLSFSDYLQVNLGDEWIGFSKRLPAGWYALRTTEGNDTFDQPLWLSAGWITGLFMFQAERGPSSATASIQMTELGRGWPDKDLESHEVNRALEIALAGLREARSVLPPDKLLSLLEAKFRNPMLGIVGAHALLLRPDRDSGLLSEVISNLETMIPGHPDLIALKQITNSILSTDKAAASSAIWPPMLLPSYRGLLKRDAEDPSAITDDSLAELVAPMLVQRGVWTTWRPVSPDERQSIGETNVPEQVQSESMPSVFAEQVDESAGPSGGIAERVNPARSRRVSSAAIRRIERYLRELAEFGDKQNFDDLLCDERISQLSLDTGVPVATARRVIESIKSVDLYSRVLPDVFGTVKDKISDELEKLINPAKTLEH